MRALCDLLLSVAVATAHAQMTGSTFHYRDRREHHDELTLLVGYHQGQHGFAEAGVGRNQYGSNHHPYDFAYYVGSELRVDRPELVGVKMGAYVDGGLAMGIQFIQYFHGPAGYTVLRPEMGIGFFQVQNDLRLQRDAHHTSSG